MKSKNQKNQKSNISCHKHEYMYIYIVFYVIVSNDVVKYSQPCSVICFLAPIDPSVTCKAQGKFTLIHSHATFTEILV